MFLKRTDSISLNYIYSMQKCSTVIENLILLVYSRFLSLKLQGILGNIDPKVLFLSIASDNEKAIMSF